VPIELEMPPAKRVKSSAASRSKAASSGRPTADDLEGENEFATLARQHWLKTPRRTAKVKVKNDVLKREIWDALEKENFPLKSILVLEGLQILERYVRFDRVCRACC
jgi:intron-binding protein aquarius